MSTKNNQAEKNVGVRAETTRDVPAIDTRATVPNHGSGHVAQHLEGGRVVIEMNDDPETHFIVTDQIARKWTPTEHSEEIQALLDDVPPMDSTEGLEPL